MNLTLRHHLERGIFDYGIGDEPYKFDYCNLHTGLLDAHIPVSAKGAAYNRILQLHQAARSKFRDTPIGAALKFARSIFSKLGGSGRTSRGGTDPAWIACLGSLTRAADA
jgi:CelD/BcsL family acetyltransferase involved in cellulose biosynthesis